MKQNGYFVQSRNGIDHFRPPRDDVHGCLLEDLGECSSFNPIATMRALEVAELQRPIQRCLRLESLAEVPATDSDSPVFMQNHSLEPLDGPTCPGMSWFRPHVSDSKLSAYLIEITLELTASVRQR